MTEVKPSLLQRLNTIRKAITVEPCAFLFLSGNLLASTASQTLALEKACRVNLNLSDAICDAVRHQDTDDNADNERIVQEYVARIMAIKSILTSVLPCILLIFAGGWMDITGRRKIMMMVPAIGEICVQTNNIINVIFIDQLRVQYLMYFEAVFGFITGAWSIFFLAIFSYIMDITSEKNRTYRLGIVSFSVYIGMPAGVALSGFLLNEFGYMTVFVTSLVMAVMNVSYLIFLLSDPVRTKEHKKHDNRGFFYFLKTFFSPAHLINSLKVVLKKTQDNRTLRLCVLLLTTCFLFGPIYGETAVVYMSTRYRFGWNELQFSIFQGYNMILNVFGSLVAILVMSKKLGWHDAVIGMLSATSKICSAFVYTFALTGGVFYLGPLIDILNGTGFVAIRAIFSKTVAPNEIGKLNSIVCITEVILPMIFIPLYTSVYTSTMQVLPGAVYLMGAGLTIPPLMVFSWLFYKHRKSVKLDTQITKDDPALSS